MTASDKQGALFVVATPLGNPEDITLRALRVLREADLIACEDTRRTGRLLAAHAITTRTISCYEHNEERRVPELIERLQAGQQVALVSDAGTPAISDPGYRLVCAAIAQGIRVTAIPGPSAVIAALAIAGLATDRFVFEGFLPTKSGERRRSLERLRDEARTIVFFEAARRLADSLQAMREVFGEARSAAVLRELTKTHEEIARGSLAELWQRFAASATLGEVTIVVEAAPQTVQSDINVIDEVGALTLLRDAGLGLKQAAELIAKLTGGSRREIYQRAVAKPRAQNS